MSKFAVSKSNFKYILAGLLVIILGYVLMVGGGSDDPNIFNDEIFSFRRIVLSPVIIILGFLIEVYAIMKRPRTKKK